MSTPRGGTEISTVPPLLLRRLVESLQDGVLIVDARHVIRHANAPARALLHLSEDVEGRALEESVGDYRVSLLVDSCLTTGTATDRDLSDPLDVRNVLARAVPIVDPESGGTVEVAVILRDETRVRRLETVRRDFVANVSHELRTPVAAIQLLVETLLGGALGDPSVAHEFVSKIGLEVAHMGQMVAELIELSTIESGRLPLRMEPTPVTELVAAAERLRPLADERRLQLRYDVDPSTPHVFGDGPRLGLVVRNLVHNAIKFTPEGGSITVSARRAAGDEDMVEIQVTDTGCGIAPDDLRRVFERFYKADRSRRREGEGSGLGLAIARHTVEAHGGRIAVQSTPGRGATFAVLLPSFRGAGTTSLARRRG
ncbi:MAG TPA: ATP-binding protein [Candidatus Dormibacteraeota bacterium]|jgi:two-component system phosphate regulon sensor histidine kinase PhoR|nr:ATP-binding protein [Candidatus Dormibacteraeota bacterium]